MEPHQRRYGSTYCPQQADGIMIEVRLSSTKFAKSYELVFNQGDEVEITGSKVKFDGADTILARAVKRGTDSFLFCDPKGKPIW